MLRHIVFCIIILILHISHFSYSSTPIEHLSRHSGVYKQGSFTITVSKVTMCKGPKRTDCCNNTATYKNGKLIINMDIMKDVTPNRGKFTITANGHLVVKLQMKKPCEQFLMKPLTLRLNATQGCEFKKGVYNISLDVENLSQEYSGGMFFYGNITMKNVMHDDTCNILCIVLETIISPKRDPRAH